MTFRANIITLGFLLLLVFAGAIYLIGGSMNSAANELSKRLVRDASSYRSNMVALEFDRAQKLQGSLLQAIRRRGKVDEDQMALFVASLGDFDVKVNRIWTYERESGVLNVYVRKDSCLFSMSVQPSFFKPYVSLPDSLSGSFYNVVYEDQGDFYWSMVMMNPEGGGVAGLLGFDFLLSDLQKYFTEVSLYGSSYVFVVDGGNRFILHPEERLLGQDMLPDDELEVIGRVRKTGREETKISFSGYLLLSVIRTYYPLRVGSDVWVIGVSLPEFVSSEEVDSFHRSAFLIACVTIVLFCVLLVYAQKKWRKEYELRLKVEQKSTEMALQQLRNRMNPHFLFNSLSSLYVLVDTNVGLAKEFIMRLSKVYRYLLEKRDAGVVPVSEELKFMEQYYFLQKIRFEDQLQLEMNISRMAGERKVPSMSLQILVENAIKHNEVTMEHPLYIRIFDRDDMLVVENDFRPRKDVPVESIGVGLEHIREIYKFYTSRSFRFYREGGVFVCELPLL